MGARPLRRAIQRYIEDPLADEVLKAGPDSIDPGHDGAGRARREGRRGRTGPEAEADQAEEARAQAEEEVDAEKEPVGVGAKSRRGSMPPAGTEPGRACPGDGTATESG